MRPAGGVGVHLERSLSLRTAALEGARERLGVEFDSVGADRRGTVNGLGVWLDKQAHANAPLLELLDDRREAAAIRPPVHPAWLVTSPGATGTSVH